MKKIIYTLFLTGITSFGYAQEGTVTIEQDEQIEKLLEFYKDFNNNTSYYTIQIYSSKSRQGAENAKANAAINFAGWSSKLEFLSESYKVTIGRFADHFEAQQKHALVKKKYPNSLLIKPKKK